MATKLYLQIFMHCLKFCTVFNSKRWYFGK